MYSSAKGVFTGQEGVSKLSIEFQWGLFLGSLTCLFWI